MAESSTSNTAAEWDDVSNLLGELSDSDSDGESKSDDSKKDIAKVESITRPSTSSDVNQVNFFCFLLTVNSDRIHLCVTVRGGLVTSLCLLFNVSSLLQ